MRQMKPLRYNTDKENEHQKFECHSGIDYDDLVFTDTRVQNGQEGLRHLENKFKK